VECRARADDQRDADPLVVDDLRREQRATIAIDIPATPAATPRRAVRGWLSHRSDRMNNTAATK